MKDEEILSEIVVLLDASQIPHMVVGSFATMVHGDPRSTRDLDLVIDPSAEQLERLLASIDHDRFYVDDDVARDALSRRSMFNLIDMTSAWKIDLVIRKARAFSIEELRRRQRVTMLGIEVFVATPEDTIVAKLEWAKLGGSERQLDDVAGVVRVRGEELDRAYIERWVAELALAAQWAAALARA